MTTAASLPKTTSSIRPVFWVERSAGHGAVRLLDQTLLPGQVVYQTIETAQEMVVAIERMIVRGAPAIGIAGAFGVVLAAQLAATTTHDPEVFQLEIVREAAVLRDSRPTAVNLMWAIDRMTGRLQQSLLTFTNLTAAVAVLLEEAQAILTEDIAMNRAIGRHGAALLPQNATILTHCNAGALATGGFGTALGVVREAFAQGKCAMVYADETRPRLQGAKLTVWELQQDNIPVTLITDGMSGALMRLKGVDAVIVGADRIALNGDTANKVGTYNLALVAKAHGVPFYIAAPRSTFDPATTTGEDIPIEERAAVEILNPGGSLIAAPETLVWNPAFDVTPHELITGFITDAGVFQANELAAWLQPA